LEEWEFGEEEEEKVALRDRVSIKEILKLAGLFIYFAALILFFRFWDFFANLLAFGSEELGQSRLLYLTLLLFPFLCMLFIVGLVDVSKTLIIPPEDTAKTNKE
ncbi:MAG: hypothetical protein U9O98_00455, partial [Asgard group archaeon]|nr:hypothetical protein [Asgard group archaeon]